MFARDCQLQLSDDLPFVLYFAAIATVFNARLAGAPTESTFEGAKFNRRRKARQRLNDTSVPAVGNDQPIIGNKLHELPKRRENLIDVFIAVEMIFLDVGHQRDLRMQMVEAA